MESGFAAIEPGNTLEIASPAFVTAGLAPRRCPPMPVNAVKKNRMNPIPKEEAQTCCGANGRGSVFENAHMVNAGAD